MRETTVDKLHIFIVMFFISLIMRMQVPIFTPFAAGFGASSLFIGVILSFTSFANLTGNLIAGPLVDRFGKKIFVILPIFAASGFFIAHGFAGDSMDLLLLHGLNGLALGFFIPAAFTLLSGYAKNSRQQGKNIAINGILSTIASIIGPLVGGKLVEVIGFVNTYYFIGVALLVGGVYAIMFLRERQMVVVHHPQQGSDSGGLTEVLKSPQLLMVYGIGFAVMYIHGVIIYEIPYLAVEQGLSTFNTGQLFSYFSIGTFLTLSLFFINRFDSFKRLMTGLFGMSMCLFALFNSFYSLPILLFFIGLFFGLIMPAMATAITEYAARDMQGRAFAFMSAVYSLGIILSSFITGAIRETISPYFIAFLIGMLALTIVGYVKLRTPQTVTQQI
ncbi:MFS transporter [Salinibacillus xinjiangensis]|uniref:MFS transporter n=1 Tax=Salinibacillus xinjiangensis TaxID=1229268 RepID=A0A6G1XA53_9BACI|nr:MFS transporter [Salinibacillus xinjiangensis]MRG87822.1 MFS transporter [Salinibacillus xinjiangensis]